MILLLMVPVILLIIIGVDFEIKSNRVEKGSKIGDSCKPLIVVLYCRPNMSLISLSRLESNYWRGVFILVEDLRKWIILLFRPKHENMTISVNFSSCNSTSKLINNLNILFITARNPLIVYTAISVKSELITTPGWRCLACQEFNKYCENHIFKSFSL